MRFKAEINVDGREITRMYLSKMDLEALLKVSCTLSYVCVYCMCVCACMSVCVCVCLCVCVYSRFRGFSPDCTLHFAITHVIKYQNGGVSREF